MIIPWVNNSKRLMKVRERDQATFKQPGIMLQFIANTLSGLYNTMTFQLEHKQLLIAT